MTTRLVWAVRPSVLAHTDDGATVGGGALEEARADGAGHGGRGQRRHRARGLGRRELTEHGLGAGPTEVAASVVAWAVAGSAVASPKLAMVGAAIFGFGLAAWTGAGGRSAC